MRKSEFIELLLAAIVVGVIGLGFISLFNELSTVQSNVYKILSK
jgi:hypothetical protein